MKYPSEIYARALLEVLKTELKDKETVMRRFVALLHKTGDARSVSKIIEAVERKLAKEAGGSYVEIQSARKLPRESIASFEEFMKKGDRVTTRVHPELIAGVRVIIDDSLVVDATLRARLQKLFTNEH